MFDLNDGLTSGSPLQEYDNQPYLPNFPNCLVRPLPFSLRLLPSENKNMESIS